MNESSAKKLANVVIAAAVVGAAYYVLRTPRLRRMAWGLTVAGLTGSIPAWFGQEIREGWRESGRRPIAERRPVLSVHAHAPDAAASGAI
jgi:hypothetical protein